MQEQKMHRSTLEIVGCKGRTRPLSVVPDLVGKFLKVLSKVQYMGVGKNVFRWGAMSKFCLTFSGC